MYFSSMKLGQNILSLMLMLCLSALSAASIQRWNASVTEIDLNVFSGLDEDALSSNVWNMSGEPWREPVGQPWLYGGKERMRDNGLNEYDFSARRLNSALCLWTTLDPLTQKFANTNPLAYCAANPIKFIDPSGCKIEDSEKLVQHYREDLEYLQMLGNTFEDINVKNLIINYAKEKLNNLNNLENSEQIYEFHTGKIAETYYNFLNDKIIITVPKGKPELLHHEMVHATQYENLEISFNEYGRGGILYDQTDETDETEAINAERIYVNGILSFMDPNIKQSDGLPIIINDSMTAAIANGFYSKLPSDKISGHGFYKLVMMTQNLFSITPKHYFKGWKKYTGILKLFYTLP